ncbi:hypothetical protein [Streptomyces sp. NPDC101178]|uniref:hypothetical protein n=1 Tax=Streptomyces sp. NPDC101178 TaxID=3366124 RepID=UPI0038148BB1
MRFRTVAASAALALLAATGAAACSSPSGAAETSRRATAPASAESAPVEGIAGRVETGDRQKGGPTFDGQSVSRAYECAVAAGEIPAECALDLSFAESSDGEAAVGAPDAR